MLPKVVTVTIAGVGLRGLTGLAGIVVSALANADVAVAKEPGGLKPAEAFDTHDIVVVVRTCPVNQVEANPPTTDELNRARSQQGTLKGGIASRAMGGENSCQASGEATKGGTAQSQQNRPVPAPLAVVDFSVQPVPRDGALEVVVTKFGPNGEVESRNSAGFRASINPAEVYRQADELADSYCLERGWLPRDPRVRYARPVNWMSHGQDQIPVSMVPSGAIDSGRSQA